MAYPVGTPSDDFVSGIYTSDFSPTVVCGAVIDSHTAVNNLGMKNSVGYQISLIQNYVNNTYLGRSDNKVGTAYINNVGDATTRCTGIYGDYLFIGKGSTYYLESNGYTDWWETEYNTTIKSSGILIRAIVGDLALYSSDKNILLYANGSDSIVDTVGQTIRTTGQGDVFLRSVNNNIVAKSNVELQNNNIFGSGYLMDDDTAESFTPGKDEGLLLLNTSYAGSADGAIVAYVITNNTAKLLTPSGTFETLNNTALDGTSGLNDRFTVSCTSGDGKIYIENRLGGTMTMSTTLIGI